MVFVYVVVIYQELPRRTGLFQRGAFPESIAKTDKRSANHVDLIALAEVFDKLGNANVNFVKGYDRGRRGKVSKPLTIMNVWPWHGTCCPPKTKSFCALAPQNRYKFGSHSERKGVN
jgi:hypothetical protein